MNGEFPGLPQAFFDNKIRWCNLLMKTKTVQSIFEEFSLKIGSLLEKELKYNKNLIQAYVQHPRPGGQVKNMYIKFGNTNDSDMKVRKQRRIVAKSNYKPTAAIYEDGNGQE